MRRIIGKKEVNEGNVHVIEGNLNAPMDEKLMFMTGWNVNISGFPCAVISLVG